MKIKCFGCGRFLKIGMGIVTRVKRFDGGEQYFCEACVADREEGYSIEHGHPITFQVEWAHVGTIEVV